MRWWNRYEEVVYWRRKETQRVNSFRARKWRVSSTGTDYLQMSEAKNITPAPNIWKSIITQGISIKPWNSPIHGKTPNVQRKTLKILTAVSLLLFFKTVLITHLDFTHPFFLSLGFPEEPHIWAPGAPFPAHFGTLSSRFVTQLKANTRPKLPKQSLRNTTKKKENPFWKLHKVHLVTCAMLLNCLEPFFSSLMGVSF